MNAAAPTFQLRESVAMHAKCDKLFVRFSSTALAAVALLTLGSLACGSVRSDGAAASERRYHGLEESCGDTGGFTPRAALDALSDEYTAPLYMPEHRERTTVRIRPSYDGGAIRCRSGGEEAPSKVAKLTAEVQLGVETDDGAFRETIPAIVSGYRHSDEFRVSGAIDTSKLDGNYRTDRLETSTDELLVEGWLALDGDRSEGAVRLLGGPSGEASEEPTVGIWDRGRYVVTHPKRPCGDIGMTRDALLRRLNGVHSGELDFEDHPDRADLRLELSATSAQVVCEPGTSSGDGARLATEIRVELESADGRLDETIRGEVVRTEGGELEFDASKPVGELDGSFRPSESVPDGTSFLVRGSIGADGAGARGSIYLETPDGENPLGVPALGTWRADLQGDGRLN